MSRLVLALKALRWLGFRPLALYGIYRLGLVTGHYRRVGYPTSTTGELELKHLLPLPARDELAAVLGRDGQAGLLAEADETAAGKVRLFGGNPVDLKLAFERPLAHWTDYETGKASLSAFDLPYDDIKFAWEPARFGWAYTLGRAYRLCGDDKYVEAFWHYFGEFVTGNPPYFGPQWMSGQEAALRLMALVWAGEVFAASPRFTDVRRAKLAEAVAVHAGRIPPTLVYARSQDNNHLLVEAVGLYTAGLALPDHPEAARWRAAGWRWLTWCLVHQIDAYGEYTQHSTNYQRLMLQAALWASVLSKQVGDVLPYPARENLGLATHWLYSLLDPESGRVPNLGANDGADIFPLASCPFTDYRPVVQAAARAFMRYQLPTGPWDEMALWFGLPRSGDYFETPRYLGDQIYAAHSWASLRAVRFKSRPSHADQLHLDLWWRGLNVAQDAGTYLYNAPAPWDNSLTSTLVHNTVCVNGREQMTRAGRFLYLDWADASCEVHPPTAEDVVQQVAARHYGYARFGVRHQRSVTLHTGGRWVVEDELLCLPRSDPLTFRLHWLLPDWEWKIDGETLRLKSPHGWITLRITSDKAVAKRSLARAGEIVYGEDLPSVVRGWVSPTYGVKKTALSLAVEVAAADHVQFTSEFVFPAVEDGP
jgi:hypothetical protein